MSARTVALIVMLFLALRIATARVALAPGLSVPALVPIGLGALAVAALGAWAVRRGLRRFRSCPHPHLAWAAP